MINRGLALACAAALPVFSAVYELKGTPDAERGWSFLPDEGNGKVCVPYNVKHENEGGRIRSPRFKLDKPSEANAFYALSFYAKTPVQGYWWVDFYDETGNLLPDINSALYATENEIPYNVVVFTDPRAAYAEISFVTKKGTAVRDIAMKQITPEEAANWCDRLNNTLPQMPFHVSDDAFSLLPKTGAALNNGTPWRILMLGDSLVNDTWCSNFQSLVMRDFPDAKLTFSITVRGSTGASYYHVPEHFRECVADFTPDLVMIGGISNYKIAPEQSADDREKNMVSLIKQCREIGAEVVLMSPPLSYKWRSGDKPEPWSEDWINQQGVKIYDRSYQYRVASQAGVAYWDVTTVPCRIVADCVQPSSWFSRDAVHNNDRGKQLIGRNLAAWFRQAKK